MSYDNKRQDYSKEHFYIIELDLDYCTLTFGNSPCTAGTKSLRIDGITNDSFNVGDTLTGNISSATGTIRSKTIISFGTAYLFTYTPTGGTFQDAETIFSSSSGIATVNGDPFDTEQCFNTVQSTQDPTNYAAGTKTYRFCTDRNPLPLGLGELLGTDDPDVIPCLDGEPSISPVTVDPSGGLSVRISGMARFIDFPHSDLNIDKNLSTRSYNPIDKGTFWTKLRSRNPNYQFKPIRVLSGYINDDGTLDVDNFTTRHYIVESIKTGLGSASINFKDPLRLTDSDKSLAPKPSAGQLTADLTGTPATFDVTSGTGSSYPSSGKVRIDDEVISFTRSSDTFTITARGENNTTQADHNEDATVQECLEYTSQQVNVISEDLLTNYVDQFDSSWIPDDDWQSEADTYLSGTLTGIITTPTEVNTLLVELSEAMPVFWWWDERSQYIRMTALKAPPTEANALDMDENLIRLSQDDDNERRINTVFIRFGQIDPTKTIDEPSNYEQTYVRIDTDSIAKYGSDKTKTINSRWITSDGKATALQAAALIGRRFADPPRKVGFSLDPKDADVWIGQNRSVNHRDIVDFTGEPVDTIFQIISVKEQSNQFIYQGLEYVYGAELDEDEGGGDPDVDLVILGTDQQNINLRSIYNGLFPDPDASTQAKFVIEGGVVIGSSTNANESLDTGSWPAGATVTLQLNSGAYVIGKGGDSNSSATAEDGGLGILLSNDLEIINNGIIGGGGGGGGTAIDSGGGSTGTGGGGGGAGNSVGLAISSSLIPGDEQTSIISDGENGTVENGGDGGTALSDSLGILASGGAGGDLGEAGQSASDGDTTYSGGAAGDAIDENGFTLTQTVAGDIRGSIVT